MRYQTVVKIYEAFKYKNSIFNKQSISTKDLCAKLEKIQQDLLAKKLDPNQSLNIEDLVTMHRLLQKAATETNGQATLEFLHTLGYRVAKALSSLNIEVQMTPLINAVKVETLKVNLAMSEPLSDQRFMEGGYYCFNKDKQKSIIASSFFGTTYAAMNKNRQEDVILSDAGYIAFKRNHKHELFGYSAVIADGYGHGIDNQQQTYIAKAAATTGKQLIKSLNQLTPNDLHPQTLETILQNLAQKVRQKAGDESSCLAGITTFPTLDKNRIRICGLSVGDCMVVAWNPQDNTWQTLLPALKLHGGPAMLNQFNMETECQLLDTMLPRNSIVLLLSDGFYDYLPLKQRQIDKKLEVSIDCDQMQAISENITSSDPSQLTRSIKKHILEQINNECKENLQYHTQHNASYLALLEKHKDKTISSQEILQLQEINVELAKRHALGDDSTILAVTLPESGTKNPSRQTACEDPEIFTKLGL